MKSLQRLLTFNHESFDLDRLRIHADRFQHRCYHWLWISLVEWTRHVNSRGANVL